MSKTNYKELLDAGVHFGHLTRKWDPKMAPYIFMERNGIHIIDLHKTTAKLDQACAALKQMAASGKRILFVGTKKQAQDILAKKIKPTGMPYVTERWAGGTLTNFATIRKAIRKMTSIDSMMKDGRYDTLSKRERLQIMRQRDKLDTQLGSISDLTRLPSALFIIDIKKEHIAVAEARKLNIPTFAMVDTNSNPTKVDFPIPANDDATESIEKVIGIIADSVAEGVEEYKTGKEKARKEKEAKQKKQEEQKAEADKKKKEEDKSKEKKEKKPGEKRPRTEKVDIEKEQKSTSAKKEGSSSKKKSESEAKSKGKKEADTKKSSSSKKKEDNKEDKVKES